MKGTERLKDLAARLAGLDERIIEVFIHSDAPKDPFQSEEMFLVCHVADPEISRDGQAFEDRGYQWGLDMSEAGQRIAQEMGIEQEIIVNPFNYEMYANGEYGAYYGTLFLQEGYEPILEKVDRERRKQEERLLDTEVPEE